MLKATCSLGYIWYQRLEIYRLEIYRVAIYRVAKYLLQYTGFRMQAPKYRLAIYRLGLRHAWE